MLETVSTRDALVERIRRLILSGELAAGSSLTETGLAQQFSVARPTVRSALQVLSARHLAVQSDGRSLTVPTLSITDVRDLYFVRRPLELHCVSTIVLRHTSLADAERVLDAMERLPADSDWVDRVELHTAFHVAVVDSVASERLSRIYATLQDEMQLCLAQIKDSYPNAQDLAAEHRALLSDLRSSDSRRATSAMSEHLDHAVENFAALIAED